MIARRAEWNIESMTDIVAAAAIVRRTAESLGADALRQSVLFAAILDAAAALRSRFDETWVDMELDAIQARQTQMHLRIAGRSSRGTRLPPSAFTACVRWAHRWAEETAPALSPGVASATEREIVVTIDPCFDAAEVTIGTAGSRELAAFDQRPAIEATVLDEAQHLNATLRFALVEAEHRRLELDRLAQELEETNRGVVALYAELDERADELRRADHAKTRFLSNVSHELRTPLNSIRALAGLLLDRLDGPLTEEQLKQTKYIHATAGELRQTVDDLLDIAKIAAGKIEVHAAAFEVGDLFGTLRGTLKPLLNGNGVSLQFDEAKQLPIMISDERKIAQILRNLVSNALKFTEAGEVRVSAETADDTRNMRFVVADTGIGIAADDRERIFEEFVQIAHPLQSKAKGTGLGLPLCRRLAGLLGGTIEVDSKPGMGSRFSVVLPRIHEDHDLSEHSDTPVDERPESTPPPLHARPSPLRLLLIDDDPAARYAVRRRLEANGVSIAEADSGESGLDALSRIRPHLVVLDLQLPDLHGLEVLRRLRALPHSRSIPVAVLTSFDVDAATIRELEDGRVPLLSKGEIGAPDFGRRLLGIAASKTEAIPP